VKPATIVLIFAFVASTALAGPVPLKEAKTLCEKGNHVACYDYGVSLIKGWRHGKQVPQDIDAGIQLLDSCCDNGLMDACSLLAQILYAGSYETVADLVGDQSNMAAPRDPTRAIVLHKKACGGGLLYSCQILGEFYEKGETVSKDPNKAAAMYEKACPEQEQSCVALKRLKALGQREASKVSIDSVRLMGQADQITLDASVIRTFSHIEPCYTTLLSTDATRAGKITLAFTLKEGSVVNAKIKSSTMNDADLDGCVLAAIQTLDTTTLNAAMTIASYTLKFTP